MIDFYNISLSGDSLLFKILIILASLVLSTWVSVQVIINKTYELCLSTQRQEMVLNLGKEMEEDLWKIIYRYFCSFNTYLKCSNLSII